MRLSLIKRRLFSTVLLIAWANVTFAFSAELPTVEQVMIAWRQREAQAHSLTAQWIHERTYTKYWANCHVPLARDKYVTLRFQESTLILDGERLRFDSGAVDSSGDVIEFDGSRHLDQFGRVQHDDARRVFRDERLRYDNGRKRVDPRNPVPADWPRNLRAFTTIFDGTRNLQFLPDERGNYPEGYVFRTAKNLYRKTLYYAPFVLTVRQSWLKISPEKCRIKEETEHFSGHDCCVLVDHTGLRREFWLDPQRDFIVLCYLEDCDVLGARMKNRIDIEYTQHPDGSRLPSAWTTTFIDNHGLMEHQATTTVTDASLNGPTKEQTFELSFPPKTWVFDETSGEHSLLKLDGTSQPIARSELEHGMTYDDLLGRGNLFGTVRSFIKPILQSAWGRTLLIAVASTGLAVWGGRQLIRRRPIAQGE